MEKLRVDMPHEPVPPRPPTRTRSPRAGGFTVVEVAVMVAVLALLASMAVPNYLGSRVASNEAAVVETLRSLAGAQARFRQAAHIDRDLDGVGEYGTLGELAGRRPLPGPSEPTGDHLIPAALGDTGPEGRVQIDSYWFAIHLADAEGHGTPDGPENRERMDPVYAERHWTCIAWPVEHGVTGEHTFFVNEQGELRKNRTERYSGTNRIPPAGAALVGARGPHQITRGRLATNELGSDGGVWLLVK
ncbi:MAG: hypothetical protein ACO4CT_10660 [Planctomycetota bacterium]